MALQSVAKCHKIELIKSQLVSHLIINETKLICVTILRDTQREQEKHKQVREIENGNKQH